MTRALPGAVGARNFPEAGADGELAFRGAFDEALASLGAVVPAGGVVVDLGCASGISTRRLAANWPGAASVLGLDLSPHFLAVGHSAYTKLFIHYAGAVQGAHAQCVHVHVPSRWPYQVVPIVPCMSPCRWAGGWPR